MEQDDWVTEVARQISGEEPLTEEAEAEKKNAASARAVEFVNSAVRKDEAVADQGRWINRVADQLVDDIEWSRVRAQAPKYYQ